MENNSLISVCVVTYNSASTVVETLDSIREQTYPNIELIVSDDCSKDATLKTVEDWVAINRERFNDCKVIKTPFNKGVSGNFNNAINNANGRWIKIIAGDDILLPNCLQFYMDYVSNHPSDKIILSRVQSFSIDENGNKSFNPIPDYDDQIEKFNTLDARNQCRCLLDEGGDMLAAPTQFIEKDIMTQYPYNELYRYMEDYPHWVKLTDSGYRIVILNELSVYYRKANSVSRDNGHYYSPRLLETKNLFFWNEKLELLRKYNCEKGYNDSKKLFLTTSLIEAYTKNKRSLFNNFKVLLIKLFTNCARYKMI